MKLIFIVISALFGSFAQSEQGICASGTWASNGVTVAGGNGNGSELNQVNPNFLHVDYRDGSIYVTDWWFDRVVKWEKGASRGMLIAGGLNRGNRSDQLGGPVGILVDTNETLIICDGQNRRVQRWYKNASNGETILANTSCRGLAVDNDGSLYVVDWTEFRVMKWRSGTGEVVAGGNGQGTNPNQLNNPIGLFLGEDRALYVVDRSNHCITKWIPGATEGVIVAGGNGQGSDLNQFNSPTGIVVDAMETIYVTDRLNNRVMQWSKGATSGIVIAGGNGAGNEANQLSGGFDLAFDRYGNLYVSDDGNFRIQMFACDVQTRLIEYDFIVRTIPSNPDGYPRSVIIMHHANSSWDVHRPFPGPLIRATLGDTLRIRITNMMRDQATAIHFHGLHMLGNPWADGTEQITQCPIAPHETFTHEFEVTQTGTFWYHSHNAQQYADGLIGPIIFDHDPIEQQYNYGSNDYIIMLQEWYHETWPDIMTAYQGPHGAYPGSVPIYPWPPTSFLINGHGQFDCRTSDCSENATWKDDCGRLQPVQCIPLRAPFFGPCKRNAHPVDEFECPPGKQIRLRLINAASGIPFRFWIDQHNLTIVARDSIEILPITVSHLHLPIGQRLDMIVTCNQNPSLQYTMYVASRNSFHPVHIITGPTPTMWTTALLTYPGSKTTVMLTNITEMLNVDSDNPFFEYVALKPLKPRFALPAVRRITLEFAVHHNNREGIDVLEEWGVNNITFEQPKEPLLQGNYLDGTLQNVIADKYPGRVDNIHATHIHYLEYGQTYEVLMINNDPQQHPWHLHGYTVDFIGAGKLPHVEPLICNRTRRQQKHGFALDALLPPLNSTPPVLTVGDSFNIPRDSYVIFRFTANNSGPWFLHCHMDWHISPGLALVFSVGHNGRYKELIQPPPKNFRMCGQRQQLLHNVTSGLIFLSPIDSLVIFLLMAAVHSLYLRIL